MAILRYLSMKYLSSVWGAHQAECLIQLTAWTRFKSVNDWNIKICKEYNANLDLAHCHLLQSRSEILRKNPTRAKTNLTKADKILRPSGDFKLNAARRKNITLRFARQAAQRQRSAD